MAESRVSRYLSRSRDYERIKAPWIPVYQALAQAFLTRKADFTHASSMGEFIASHEVFDNTGQFAAHVFASVCLSMLWPDAARTFNIVPVSQLKDQPGVEAYFRSVTKKMHLAMDRSEAGLLIAFMEYFLDQGIFGTSGVANFDGPEDDPSIPVVFEAWDVKAMCISQNAQGYVDTVFFKINRTVRQVYEEYGNGGRDRISNAVKEQYAAGKYEEKVEILKVVEPKTPEAGKKGIAGMKVRTVHIDVTNKVLMREGGYEEMPIHVGRMFKRIDETQGRSSGMIALADAVTMGGLTEGVIVATEKQLDPPLALLDDGRLGGAVVDTSAGGFSVLNASGRLGGEKPIFPLFTVGEMQSAEKLMERLEGKLMQAFFLDRLLDLNNKTMMTAYETSIRNRLRGESVGSIFARQIMEVITPTIKGSFNRMYRKGHFGDFPGTKGAGADVRRKWRQLTGKEDIVVPEIVFKAIEAGLDVYDIEYISPAQRFMEAEKLQGMFTGADALAALEPVLPGITDNIDKDVYARKVWKFAGAANDALRTLDDLRDFRAANAARQNAAAALETGKGLAEIQAKSAQARAALGTTGGA